MIYHFSNHLLSFITYRAASNRKLKEQVALELSFVNSNLQLLKEELAEINSDVEAYQNDSYMRSIPLIPLGLKETKKLDARVAFTVSHQDDNVPCL